MNDTQSAPDWLSLLTPAAARSEKSLIREMFKRLRKGDITSFAGGMPDTSLFPYERVQDVLSQLVSDKTERITALNYGPSEGYQPLREWIASHMGTLGLEIKSDNILITSGGQQALDLTCRSMLSPGDKVVVAAPTYLGALQIIRSYGASIISVPTDNDGPLPEFFDAALSGNVKFSYLVSDFSNPTGQTISAERRRTLIALARMKGVPIVDDAAYQQLRFNGDPVAPLIAVDQETSNAPADPLADGTVIHIGTFSKTMMPGLRVGWMAAPRVYLEAVSALKQATDLHSPMLNQMTISKLVHDIFDQHIDLLRQTYRTKRDCMIAALRHHLPKDVTFTEPQGGMFIWLTLPETSNAIDLLPGSMEEAKVAYIPGAPFFATPEDGRRHCRLSFSGVANADIEAGVERFGAFLATAV